MALSDTDDEMDELQVNGMDDDNGSEEGTGIPTTSSVMRTLHRRTKTIMTWENLLSILLLDGSTPFTERQYMSVSDALHTAQGHGLRCPRSVSRCIRRNLLMHSYPTSRIADLGENATSRYNDDRTDTVSPFNAGSSNAVDCVRMVLPSEWAKLDVVSMHFYRSVFETCNKDERGICIESSPMVTKRPETIMAVPRLKAKFKKLMCTDHAEEGDLLNFPCSRRPSLRSAGVMGWIEFDEQCPSTNVVRHFVTARLGRTIGVEFEEGQWGEEGTDASTALYPRPYLYMERLVHAAMSIPTRNLDASLSVPGRQQSAQGRLRQTTLTDDCELLKMPLYPGDTVTALRPTECEVTESTACFLICSAVSGMLGRPAEKIVWVTADICNSVLSKVDCFASTNVTGMPYFADTDVKMCRASRTLCGRRNIGRLSNGERFVVYRVALYADGFQQNKSTRQSKSVGGVYLLPLGLPVHQRMSFHSVRVLCLTAHGSSINAGLNIIRDDLLHGSRHGVPGIDPFGRPVRIFVDAVGLFGDFPQAAAFTDVLGHTANALCTLCFMRRRKGQNLPETNFSSEVHSGRLGFARFNARRAAIRSARPDPKVLRALGMKYHEAQACDELIAVRYATESSKTTSGYRTSEGRAVVPQLFDHALSVPVLPDHLLSSMVSYVLRACFKSLPTNDARSEVEMRIVQAAQSNGLGIKNSILSWERTKTGMRYKGVSSNSMSAWFAILVVASPIFEDAYEQTQATVHLLPRLLQSLIAVLYRWPKKRVEGRNTEDWDFRSKSHRFKYQHRVTKLAVDFLNAAREEYVRNKEIGVILDKPITHRLLELVYTTIPAYGHMRLCSELVLEQAHTQFKRWLVLNTHTNAHITAMEKAIGRDWMWRLACLHRTWNEGSQTDRRQAELGIIRLVVGELGVKTDLTTSAGERYREDVRQAVHRAMRPPVPRMLEENMIENDAWMTAGKYVWTAARRNRNFICEDGAHLVDNIVAGNHPPDVSPSDLVFCKRARFIRQGQRGRAYRYNVVEIGDAISAVVTQPPQDLLQNGRVNTLSDGNGDCRYYAVFNIVRNAANGDVWVIAKEMQRPHDGTQVTYSCDRSSFVTLLLEENCRRVALVHQCTDDCVRGRGYRLPQHSPSVRDGGKYHIIARADGFPPFQG